MGSEVAPAVYPIALFEARSRADWKKLPAVEILANYLQGPVLVFDHQAFSSSDRQAWHPAVRGDQLQTLRDVYRLSKNEGHRLRLEREARQLWLELVERAVGYRWPGGDLIAWPARE